MPTIQNVRVRKRNIERKKGFGVIFISKIWTQGHHLQRRGNHTDRPRRSRKIRRS